MSDNSDTGTGLEGRLSGLSPVCPLCGKARHAAFRPFCSKRCADIDLNRWLSGVYAVPAISDEEPESGDRQA